MRRCDSLIEKDGFLLLQQMSGNACFDSLLWTRARTARMGLVQRRIDPTWSSSGSWPTVCL